MRASNLRTRATVDLLNKTNGSAECAKMLRRTNQEPGWRGLTHEHHTGHRYTQPLPPENATTGLARHQKQKLAASPISRKHFKANPPPPPTRNSTPAWFGSTETYYSPVTIYSYLKPCRAGGARTLLGPPGPHGRKRRP